MSANALMTTQLPAPVPWWVCAAATAGAVVLDALIVLGLLAADELLDRVRADALLETGADQ